MSNNQTKFQWNQTILATIFEPVPQSMLLFSRELRLAYKLEHESATTKYTPIQNSVKMARSSFLLAGLAGTAIQEIEMIRSPENPRNMATIANKLVADEI
jgi:hypothetical protein